jgi:hypothetical protein
MRAEIARPASIQWEVSSKISTNAPRIRGAALLGGELVVVVAVIVDRVAGAGRVRGIGRAGRGRAGRGRHTGRRRRSRCDSRGCVVRILPDHFDGEAGGERGDQRRERPVEGHQRIHQAPGQGDGVDAGLRRGNEEGHRGPAAGAPLAQRQRRGKHRAGTERQRDPEQRGHHDGPDAPLPEQAMHQPHRQQDLDPRRHGESEQDVGRRLEEDPDELAEELHPELGHASPFTRAAGAEGPRIPPR